MHSHQIHVCTQFPATHTHHKHSIRILDTQPAEIPAAACVPSPSAPSELPCPVCTCRAHSVGTAPVLHCLLWLLPLA